MAQQLVQLLSERLFTFLTLRLVAERPVAGHVDPPLTGDQIVRRRQFPDAAKHAPRGRDIAVRQVVMNRFLVRIGGHGGVLQYRFRFRSKYQHVPVLPVEQRLLSESVARQE